MQEGNSVKSPWYDRLYELILKISGLRVAVDFIKTLGSPQQVFEEQKQLLEQNLQDEDELCRVEFKAVLNRWGNQLPPPEVVVWHGPLEGGLPTEWLNGYFIGNRC